MSRRYSFSNAAIEGMIRASGDDRWTLDIPNAEIARAFPLRGEDGMLLVTPARESAKGRGQPVFDAYHPELPTCGGSILAPCLLSFKVSKEGRNPRNAVLTTGKGDRHLDGVLRAVREEGTEIPLICYNYVESEDQWYRCEIDAARVIREHEATEATGKRGIPLVLSKARRPSGKDEFGNDKFITYTSLRVNIGPCIELGYTEGWVKVDAPTMPAGF